MYILRKKVQNLKKHIIFHFMTTFYDYAFTAENNLAEGVVKPIFTTRNGVLLLCMFVLYIDSRIKNKIYIRKLK